MRSSTKTRRRTTRGRRRCSPPKYETTRGGGRGSQKRKRTSETPLPLLSQKQPYDITVARKKHYDAEQFEIIRGDFRDEVRVTLKPGQGLQIYNGDMIERSDGVFVHKTFQGAWRRAIAGEEARMPTRYVPAAHPTNVPYHVTLSHDKHAETLQDSGYALKMADVYVQPLPKGHRLLFRDDDDLLACTANIHLSFSASIKRAVTGSFTLPMLRIREDATGEGFLITIQPDTRRITVARGRSAVVRPSLFYMASLDSSATFEMTKTFKVGFTSERGFFKFTGPCTIYIISPILPAKLKQQEVIIVDQHRN